MVRLNRIYTRVGDKGVTMLGDGSRVPKTHARVEAYGAVDEANAAVGWALAALSAEPMPRSDVMAHLTAIQNELFDVGADLSKPLSADEEPGASLRVRSTMTARLEHLIDDYNASLEPLDSFVLPGGTDAAAALHVARTVVRRAERRVARLLEQEPESTNQEALVYLNRLSDLLFVLARVANAPEGDVLWRPGGEPPAE